MIPVNMILSLDQGPKWQARWNEGKVSGDDALPAPKAVPRPAFALLPLLRLARLVRAIRSA